MFMLTRYTMVLSLGLLHVSYTLVCSINAIGVWLQCVMTAQRKSCPFPTHHPSLKESVLFALKLFQLAA